MSPEMMRLLSVFELSKEAIADNPTCHDRFDEFCRELHEVIVKVCVKEKVPTCMFFAALVVIASLETDVLLETGKDEVIQ